MSLDDPLQYLWEAILDEVERIEKEHRTKASREIAYYPRDGSHVATVADVPLPDGSHAAFLIKAYPPPQYGTDAGTGPKVVVRRYFHSNEDYWEQQIGDEPERRVVVDGIHYRLGKNGNRATLHNGFGGQRHDIEFTDGRKVTTYDLWYQGRIPPKFREALPDNAQFVQQPAEVKP